jgi:hypothetical protein
MTYRYSLNPVQIPSADAYLAKAAERAEPMRSAEAEAFFDREWWRLLPRLDQGGTSSRAAASAVLVGLSCMRSMARHWKELGY